MTIITRRWNSRWFSLLALALMHCGPGGEDSSEDFSNAILEESLTQEDFNITVQQLTKLPYLPWAYTPDGCEARALYYSMVLASKKVSSKKVYVETIGAKLLNGQWGFHVAPMVTKNGDTQNLYVLDPVFDKTRALTVVEWASKMGFANPSAAEYPHFHVNPSHILEQAYVVPGIALPHPEDPNVSLYKEPAFSELGKWRIPDIEIACNQMHGYINVEPGLTETQRASKHKALGANTKTLAQTLSTLSKLSGSPSTLTNYCLRTLTEEKFVATAVPKTIPDNNATGVTSQLVVQKSGLGKDYMLQLNITHPDVSQLKVRIRAPSGQEMLIYSGTGRGTKLTGLYSLAAFNNVEVNGIWKLVVSDTVATGTGGALTGWTLTGLF